MVTSKLSGLPVNREKNKNSALFVKEDFIGDDGVFAELNWIYYQQTIEGFTVEELRQYEDYLIAGDGQGGQYVNKSARNRVRVRDLWGLNNLKYCDEPKEDKKSNPLSVIGSARDQSEAQVNQDAFDLAVAGVQQVGAYFGDLKTEVSRINKTQCNRLSAYTRIEIERLRTEARAMAEDAKSESKNAVVFDLYSKLTIGGIVALSVGTVLSIGALAVGKLGSLIGTSALAKLGWLGKIITVGLPLALPRIWGYAVQSFYFIYNFDWNITDLAIDRGTTAGISTLAGSLGSLIGGSMGWLACGLAPASAIAAADPIRGLMAKKEVTEEAIEELSDELWILVNQATRQIGRAAFLQGFKHLRRWIKDPNSPQYKVFTTVFGKGAIDNWGKGTPFTIAGQVNNAIEAVADNPVIQGILGVEGANALSEGLEETVEEFLDSCIEAGFVLTGAYSQALLQSERQRVSLLGKMKTVEIELNRKSGT